MYFKMIFIAAALLLCGTLTAQPRAAEGITKMIDQINGRPSWQKMESIEGSVFLSDNWNEGFVRFSDGAIAKNILLKFNVQLNELYFMRQGQPFLFNTLPSAFSFGYSEAGKAKIAFYRSGYPAIENKTSNTFYEVIADGKLQLLKYSTRFIEKSPVSAYSADVANKFATREFYYLYYDKGLVPLVLSKKSLLQALGNYKTRAEEWIEKNEAKMKSEESVVMLISYLNAGRD